MESKGKDDTTGSNATNPKVHEFYEFRQTFFETAEPFGIYPKVDKHNV